MKVVRIVLLAIILVFILSSLASAQGGLTIGGPATFTYPAGTSQNLFISDSSMNVCLTVEPIAGTAEFSFKRGGGGGFSHQVSLPITICHSGIATIAAECTIACSFVWRIDKAD